jgi:hypothetical protein
MKTIDVTGKIFGRLTVIKMTERPANSPRETHWLCRCECSKEIIVSGWRLRNLTKSCVCSITKHGKSNSALYNLWMSMNSRCKATKGENYHNYVLRGITVCERWRDFEEFESDMGARPSKNHSIDRKDNSKGYEPGNCYWATPEQQMRNKRKNRIVNYQGEMMTLAEAAEKSGINYSTAKSRLNAGLSEEEAFS